VRREKKKLKAGGNEGHVLSTAGKQKNQGARALHVRLGDDF